MMAYSKKDLAFAFRKVGLGYGDVVKVSAELFKLGRMEGVKTKEEYCQAILDAIMEVIGPEGTIVVNTYTSYVGRYGVPFDYERSRPTTGVFPEYILFKADSVRSLHPLNSVTAIGKHKEEICRNVSLTNYGWGSPFDRLLRRECKVLRLGLRPFVNAFFHVAEMMCGVPYIYNKVLDSEVFVSGKKVNKVFLASVCYLDYNLHFNLERLIKELAQENIIRTQKVGAGEVHCLDANEYCGVLTRCLLKDPYYFLDTPPNFVKGVIPWDGFTKGRDNVALEADYLFNNTAQGKRK